MNIAFIHQNIPGQWRHISAHLASSGEHRIVMIGKHKRVTAAGLEYRRYGVDARYDKPDQDDPNSCFASAQVHGRAVADILRQLKKEGFVPDVIASHPGWGESLFAKDVLPEVPLLHYCEFYYRSSGSDHGFLTPGTLDGATQVRARNAGLLLSLAAMDWGLSPTAWQKQQHPHAFHNKISVLHEGIDTSRVQPDAQARLTLPTGRVLTAKDEVLTYVARNLEPHRGFDQFLRAAQILQRQRPQAHVVIVGGEGTSYSKAPADGRTWKEHCLERLTLDPLRTHFLGVLPYQQYLTMLQISSVHVYLSIPFVLSWSMMEAMSAGCLVIGSDTAPVRELLTHGHNGLLVDFFDVEKLARLCADALARPAEFQSLRAAARATIMTHYDQRDHCLPALTGLLQDIANGRTPPLRFTATAAETPR